MKAWLIMIADETPDRNMSDLVRDGVRLLMAEYGYDEAGEQIESKQSPD
jgi:hypothetical protein